MKKSKLFFYFSIVIEIVIFFLLITNIIPTTAKIWIAIVFVLIQLIFVTSMSRQPKSEPNSVLPDNDNVWGIICKYQLQEALTVNDVLKEYDKYKSFKKRKQSYVSRYFISNECLTNEQKYKEETRYIEWDSLINELYICHTIHSEKAKHNKEKLLKSIKYVYGYDFCNTLDQFYYIIKDQLSDYEEIVNLYSYIQNEFVEFADYSFYTKTMIGPVTFANWIEEKNKVNEIKPEYYDIMLFAINKTKNNISDIRLEKILPYAKREDFAKYFSLSDVERGYYLFNYLDEFIESLV
jgi:hypothetical protein